jgi:epoxyqueuosine reductase
VALIDTPVTLQALVLDAIQSFCHSPQNSLQTASGEAAWDDPLVGFAAGDDALFEAYKEYVGPFHWTPKEAFALAFPETPAAPQDLTVVAWVLPQTEATKADNRQERVYPAERWARARIFGEKVNTLLRRHVVQTLSAARYEAAAPMLLPQFSLRDSQQYLFASTWSERHMAYAAGLGTFGLCDGLITPRGKAVRVGSVVVRGRVPPTPRPYTDHHAYCLFYTEGTCGDCIDRCPVKAISASGHDKASCDRHLERTKSYVREHFGFDGYGCGLCQTGVPCESRVPPRSQ